MNKIPKPPWINWCKRPPQLVYVSELPAVGRKGTMYNVIGTELYVGWVDGKYIKVNHHYRLAEYDVAWLYATSQFHKGPPPKFIGMDMASDDKFMKDLIAARDYIENCEDPPEQQFPSGPLYFRL